MGVIDVAQIAVRMGVEGFDPTRSALETIEVLGQRAGRAVDGITVNVGGATAAQQQAQSIGTGVARTLAGAVPPIAVRFTTPGADQALAIVAGARREAAALARGLDGEAAAAQGAARAEAELARARDRAASAAASPTPALLAPAPAGAGTAAAPRDHNVIGHIPGLDELGRESAEAAAAQAALVRETRQATQELSAEERRVAAVVTSVEEMAAAVDVSSTRQIASFRANARAAGEYLETIHAGEQAAERVAAAMLDVTNRAAQAAAAPRLPSPSASPSSRPVDDEGGTAAIRRRVAMLEQATRIESTRSEALTRLGGVEAGLARALERTNLTLQQRVTLEQLLARTQTAGRSAPPPPAFGTADTGALSRRIGLLTQGTQVDATFAESVTKLTGVQGGLEAALKRSNLTLEERIALGGQLARVEAALAGAAGGATAQIDKSGAAATVAASKYRGAANGLTVLALSAVSGGQNLQSLALTAGLTASSLAEIGGTAGLAAVSIGAVVTVGAALVAIYQKVTEKGKATAEQLNNLRVVRSFGEGTTAAAQLDRQIDLVVQRLAELRAQTFQPITGGLGTEGLFKGPIRAFEQRLDALREVRKALGDQTTTFAAEEAEQRRQAVVGGLRAENTAVAAAADAQLAAHRIRYDQGRSDLASYTDARVASLRAGAAREIDELRAQQRALRDDTGREPGKIGTTETKAARDARLAEATQLDSAIRAVRNRAAGEEQQAAADRESQARALADRLVGYEAEVATARGDAHAAALLQIGQRVDAFARGLAQEGRLTAEQQEVAARFYGDTLTRQADAAEAQRVLAREQNALGAKRAEIQARVNAGTITELQGAQEIAAAERERMPALNAQLAIIERIAKALGNPELLAFVRQARAEMEGMGTALTPLQERMKAVFNDIAARGTATAAAVKAKIDEMVAGVGGAVNVTPAITFQAEQLAGMGASLDAQFENLGMNAADALTSAIHAGISAFGSEPITFKTFFENAGNALLQGLGGIMSDMGTQLLLMGAVMTGLLPHMFNPFTSGPAMLIAGGILLTAGAALGAIATRNSRGGGGGGSVSAPANFDQSASVILTPRAAGKAPDPVRPIIQHFTVLGDTPEVQRFISKVTVSASRRGMPVGATG